MATPSTAAAAALRAAATLGRACGPGRAVAGAARAAQPAAVAAAPWFRSLSGNIAGGSMGDSWKGRERAAEEIYFNKEDAATLSRLAAKLHKATEPTPQAMIHEKEELSLILNKHGVQSSDALLEELLKFKFNKH